MPSNTLKTHNAASILGVVSWPQNGGNRHASFTFAITTAPTPILGVAFRLPKWELKRWNENFWTHTQNKTEPFNPSKFQNMQPNILPQESNLLTKKTDCAGTPQQNAIYVSWIALSEIHFANRGFNPEFKNLRLQIIKFRFRMPSNTLKTHNAASVLGVVSWPQNGGNRHASFTFAITTAPTPILGVAFRLPKWELKRWNENFWTHTQKKTEPFILSKFQNMQPNILPQESNLLTKKTDCAGTPQQNAIYVSWIALSEIHFANRGFNPEFKNLRLQIIKFRFRMPSNTLKTHNAASVLGVVSWPQNGGNRHASFTFAITTAPTPILGVAFRLPKWELKCWNENF